MSNFSFCLSDILSRFLIVWRRVISNGDAIQGITSCLALYFTWKLFIFTRKKPQINLEYDNSILMLKNVGDMILKNISITIIDIRISKNLIETDDGRDFWKIFIEKFGNRKGIKIPLGDLGIEQSYKVDSDLLLLGRLSLGYSIFEDKKEIYDINSAYHDKCWELMNPDYTLPNDNEYDDQPDFTDEIESSKKDAFGQIMYIEILVEGDGYKQTIKYMR